MKDRVEIPYSRLFIMKGGVMRTLILMAVLLIGTIEAKAKDLTKEEIIALITYEANRSGVDAATALAIAEQESSFRPNVERWEPRHKTYSVGLFQIFIPTAKTLGVKNPTKEKLKDPVLNIRLGIAHMSKCVARFGNDPKMIACCHNAGHFVKKSFCSSYAWTKQYIKDVGQRISAWNDKLSPQAEIVSPKFTVAQEF